MEDNETPAANETKTISVADACDTMKRMIENVEFVIEGEESEIRSLLHQNTSRTLSLPNTLKKKAPYSIIPAFSRSGSLKHRLKIEKRKLRKKKTKRRIEMLQNQISIEIIKKQSLQQRLSVYQTLEPSKMILLCDIYHMDLNTDETLSKTTELLQRNHKLHQEIINIDTQASNLSESKSYSKKLAEQTQDMRNSLEGYNEIEITIRDLKTKEGYNIQRFVVSYLNGEQSVEIWSFIDAIANSLISHMKGVTITECTLTIENFIFPVLYNKMLSDLGCKEKDKELFEKCKSFTSISQGECGIPEDLQDTALIPYYSAIANLRTLFFQPTPTKKLMTLLEAAGSAYKNAERICPQRAVGGDDFIDIWVYVVIQSQIRNLASTMAYISTFSSSQSQDGEMGYYFSCLDVARKYIEDLNRQKLRVLSPIIVDVHQPIIVFEREKFKKFCKIDKHIDCVHETVVLSGFQLFVMKDWYLSGKKFFSTFVVPTGDENDKVIAAVIQPNEGVTGIQEKFLVDTFFSKNDEKMLSPLSHDLGMIPATRDHIDPSSCQKLELIHLPSGDFDGDLNLLRMLVNLEFMGISGRYSKPYVTAKNLQKLSEIFMMKSLIIDELPVVVRKYVGRIQTYLRILGYYLSISAVDSTFTELTQKSLFLFYKDYNDALCKFQKGELDKQEAVLWWDCSQELFPLKENFDSGIEAKLEWRLIMLLQALKVIGYDIPDIRDDDYFYNQVEIIIKQYQAKNKIFETSASFSTKTLNSMLADLSRMSLSVGLDM